MTTNSNRLISDDDDELPQSPATAVSARPLPSPAPPKPEPTPRRNGRGGAYPGRRQINSYIPENLFMWFKVISAQTRKPMVDLMEEALTEYRDRYAAQQKFGNIGTG